MKIAICGSMTFSPEMIKISNKLKEFGHEVTLPEFTEKYAVSKNIENIQKESTQNKISYDLIRAYFNIIKDQDAVLIYNKSKNGIENYVGANTFLEMGFAHVLNKTIFMYNSIPEMYSTEEMKAMQPKILNGNLEKILNY